MWSKGEFKAILEAKALLRKGVSNKAEEAALLFARLEGWTAEEGIDFRQTEAALNTLLDDMDEEDWEGLKKVADTAGDATFKGVLTYAVRRIRDVNAEAVKATARSKDWRRDTDRS
jgi:hypothetical protein